MAGITDSALAHACRSGRWVRLYRGVYLTNPGEVSTMARIWSAYLYAGDGAAVSHSTAASLHGWRELRGNATPVTHLTVPRERFVTRQPTLVMHRSHVADEDLCQPGGLMMTTPLRTLLDLLSECTTSEQALGLVAGAIQHRRIPSTRQLRERLVEGNTRWRGTLLRALGDIVAGSHSVLELEFVTVLRQHGLPVGQRQAALGHMRVDMAYETLIIELDGRLGHDEALEIWRDKKRDNAHSADGRMVLRFGWFDVTSEGCAVAKLVAAALGTQARCAGLCTRRRR